MVANPEKLAQVQRVLDRYLVEVVETYGLCPWARSARTGGEVGVAVLWGTPELEDWYEAAKGQLARPAVRVAMIVAPELAASPQQFRGIRETVARVVGVAGVADFHPDAERDLATPARLVPFLRRSPDPLLQFVPLALLDSVRSPPAVMGLAEQAQLLGGVLTEPRDDIADRIAATNHARVSRDHAAIEAVLADIAADRRRSYSAAGIAINTSR